MASICKCTKKLKLLYLEKAGADFWFSGPFLTKVVDSFQYLGLKLSYNGKLSCAQQDLASRGLRAIYASRNNLSQLVDPDVKMLL